MWLQDAGLHPDLLSFLESNESQPIVEQLRGKTTCATSQPASVAVKKLATAVDFLHRNDNIFNIDSFNFDLISAVNRQLKFATKMTCLAWRHSPFFHSTLISAINRYQHFFQMMKEHSQLAPTLDIDLVWHTHQLTPSAYWQYSRDVAGRFVNHNDMISEDRAGLSFRNTISVYQKSFGESYSLCLCWFCEASRHSQRPVEETMQTVQRALETEMARRLNTGLLVNSVFASAHCSKCACHHTKKCVLELPHVKHAFRSCNEESDDGKERQAQSQAQRQALGSCNGQPWCEDDCESGGCDESESQMIHRKCLARHSSI